MLVAVLVAVLVFFAFAASVTSSFLLVVVASLATSLPAKRKSVIDRSQPVSLAATRTTRILKCRQLRNFVLTCSWHRANLLSSS